MAIHYPSFKQLQYLTALVRTEHFGQAAEQCFVTQSTLSASIAELEALLGVQLVERINKRNIIITPMAKLLAERADRMLQEAEAWVKTAGQSMQEPQLLRIGIIPTIAPFLLPAFLPLVNQYLPEIQVQSVELTSHSLVEQVSHGQLDLGILALPFDIGALHSTSIKSDQFFVAMPRGHRLASQDVIKGSELIEEHLLLLEESHCLSTHALQVCRLSYDNQVAGSSLFTLVQLVLNDQGVTVVPEMAVNALQKTTPELMFIRLDEPEPHREIALIYRNSWQGSSVVDHIAQLMKNEC